MTGFTSFVMFAEMRTGSNFLEANLNALEGVECHGEVFNPHFMGKKDNLSLWGIDIAQRDADPFPVLAAMRAATPGLAGFRCFHDHDARVIDAVLADPACAKIILTRNPVESYVSLKIAQDTGQWKLQNAAKLKSARAHFDAAEFEAHLRTAQEFQLYLLHGLQVSGQTAFYIDYEDLNDLEVLNGLAAFLGIPARLEVTDPKLKKQNPEEIAEKVTNPAEMEHSLARLDRFNLARTPNFEPRRTPGIPGFVAAADAPLLYMPLRGGPEAEVRAWLGRLGAGGIMTDFAQKTLRQWKRQNGGHRSFTVLRHPLLRVYAAFQDAVMAGGDLHRLLVRSYKLDLPAPDQALTAEEERAAFLAVLRWLKLYLSGQTGQKIDPRFASQTAVLQGFAQFQGPDAVLREERLAEGLAWLCAETDVAMPDFTEDNALPDALARIHDREIEDAAREAYQRDYVGYGFGRWRG
ncbi:nodulation protein NodH [Gemmobacter lutimaris]|uniref:Nodulation protein NodH n=1 Tax=Gemmobacter lutimaris TaxID=2306023 RepID=A0A398BPH2_9RHOB|nr:nodulation protein NodH [Gemmobacter lutimaris]